MVVGDPIDTTPYLSESMGVDYDVNSVITLLIKYNYWFFLQYVDKTLSTRRIHSGHLSFGFLLVMYFYLQDVELVLALNAMTSHV